MDGSTAEQENRDALVARLSDRFPEVPEPRIRDEVASGFGRYAEVRVRDFVELLVEREVAAQLRVRGPS